VILFYNLLLFFPRKKRSKRNVFCSAAFFSSAIRRNRKARIDPRPTSRCGARRATKYPSIDPFPVHTAIDFDPSRYIYLRYYEKKKNYTQKQRTACSRYNQFSDFVFLWLILFFALRLCAFAVMYFLSTMDQSQIYLHSPSGCFFQTV
jgi:hypothetical protein